MLGIEQHQRGGDIFQKDGVDLPVDVLARQIPQHGFALGAVCALEAELRDGPELLTVRGGMFLELAMRQPPAQSRFADARIADQDEFRSGVVDALLRLTEQERFVQLPDADDGVFFPQRRQHRQARVKGKPEVQSLVRGFRSTWPTQAQVSHRQRRTGDHHLLFDASHRPSHEKDTQRHESSMALQHL